MIDTHLQGLIKTNLNTLRSAAHLLKGMTTAEFTQVHRPHFDSSLGKHLRHVLDHYLCFRRDFPTGLINYDQRQRDSQLEADKDHALNVIQELCYFLESMTDQTNAEKPLSVLMCNDIALPQGEITRSSLGRELQFLQGHSVHHYALMAAMLRFAGKTIDLNFGVAPSTLVYEERVYEETAKESA